MLHFTFSAICNISKAVILIALESRLSSEKTVLSNTQKRTEITPEAVTNLPDN